MLTQLKIEQGLGKYQENIRRASHEIQLKLSS